MANSYTIIDEKNWKRAAHCAVYKNYLEPCYCTTFELDITKFLARVKKENLSFTMAMVYTIAKCASEIEEFRYRFLDGQVVLYDKIDTAFTYLDKETELFKVVLVPFIDNLFDYITVASKTANEQKEYFTGPLANDIFLFSAIPWVPYTHISHTASGKKFDSTPLFNWGKYFERDGKILLPFSVQAHHSFVDGIHIGKLYNLLQQRLSDESIFAV